MDRNTTRFYVFNWNATTRTLTNDLPSPGYRTLPGMQSAVGLALDEVNDILYVGDMAYGIRSYNTGTWTSLSPISSFIAADAHRRHGSLPCLVRLALAHPPRIVAPARFGFGHRFANHSPPKM